MKKYFIIYGILLCLPFMAWADTKVSFHPPIVALGESTELVIETDRPLTAEPDLSGLIGNFAVAGQQQRKEGISINGKRRVKYSLVLNVFPRKEGELSTGDLVINGKTIQAAVLKVEPAGTNTAVPITFTASANQTTVYPDETFLLTIKLTQGVALLGAKIMTPTLENARITPLEMDKTFQEYKDGRPVYVFERTFAVIPEKAGYLTIPGIEVYGLVADTAGQNDLFSGNLLLDGLLGGQKEIRLETNSVQITVLEKPAEWSGWWLPATQVSLSTQDSFSDKVSVGESLTRIIKLTALGTEADKLPVPKQSATDGLKVYPSPEQRETIQTPVGDIQGVLTTSYILVPSKAGQITIPEVRVPWFNTKTRQTEEAILPAKVITVTGTTEQVLPEVKTPAQTVKKSDKKPVTKTPKKKKETTQKSSASTTKNRQTLWWVIGSSAVALGIGLGLGFLLFRRRKHHSYRIQDNPKKRRKKKKPLPDLYPF